MCAGRAVQRSPRSFLPFLRRVGLSFSALLGLYLAVGVGASVSDSIPFVCLVTIYAILVIIAPFWISMRSRTSVHLRKITSRILIVQLVFELSFIWILIVTQF